MELINRPRRLRQNDSIRRLCRETRLSPDSLIYPIFVDETLTGKRPIDALEGQFHYGLDAVCEAVEECIQAASGSGLMARSLEPVSDSVSPSLSAPPPFMLCLSLSPKK